MAKATTKKKAGAPRRKRAPKPRSGRKTIPTHVRDEVLLEAGYMCGSPRCRQILVLELHHMVWVKAGGGNVPSNLIALCRNCHGLHTMGKIPDTAIRVWKSMLVSLNSVDRGGVDHLLYIYQTAQDRDGYRYTVDTMLLLARLFNAGLIERSGGSYGGGSGGGLPFSSQFKIDLTDRGRQLVEGWLAGDPNAVSKAG